MLDTGGKKKEGTRRLRARSGYWEWNLNCHWGGERKGDVSFVSKEKKERLPRNVYCRCKCRAVSSVGGGKKGKAGVSQVRRKKRKKKKKGLRHRVG